MATIVTGTGGAAASGGTPAVVLGTANTAGAASTFVRDDDTILAFDDTAPTNSALADAAGAGSAGVAARRDHKHGREAGGAPALTFGTANVAGTSGTPIDANSTVAAFDATAPVTQAFSDVAATGAAGTMARRDHKHGMPASPGGISQAYQTVDNAGVALTQRSIVNFSGPGVVATDNAGATRTDVTNSDPTTTTILQDDMLTPNNPFQISGVAVTGNPSQASVVGHPGIRIFSNGTTATTGVAYIAPAAGAVQVIGPTDSWDVTFIFSVGALVSGQTGFRVGMLLDTANVPTDGAYLEKLIGDTDWFFVNRVGSAQNRIDSGVAVVAGTFYKIRIRRIDASTIGYTLGAAAEVTNASDNPNGIVAMNVALQCIDGSSGSSVINLDYVHLVVTGLSR